MKKWERIERAFNHYLKAYRADVFNHDLFNKAWTLCSLLTDHMAGKTAEVTDAQIKASAIWTMYYGAYGYKRRNERMYKWAYDLCYQEHKRICDLKEEIRQQLWDRA